jgi:hypothetical protein
MYEDYDPLDEFISSIVSFVETYTNFTTYEKMSEETRTKFIEKLTLMIVFETSPRKNYNISMQTIRLWVRDILEARRLSDDESTES